MIATLDRCLALVGLVVTSPLVLASAIAVKVSSPGPVVFRARRAGRDGAPFDMYKLRTMHLRTEPGARITSAADPRVFPVGRVLRRTKLDELPQLVNVLRGEMLLVGPRPEDVSIVAESYDGLLAETLRYSPGLTSPGSLHYYANEQELGADAASAEAAYLSGLMVRKAALDLVYLRHQSLGYHVQILCRTALSVLGFRLAFPATRAREIEQAEELMEECSRRQG